MPQNTCTRKHALVTGANSGIGRATVNALVAKGWHVFAGIHQADHPGDPYDDNHVTAVTIDVTDEGQLDDAVRVVADHLGDRGLDALVDNAGIGISSPLEFLPLAKLRTQFEINVIGQVAVTQRFLPLLRKTPGRIVFISSIGDRIAMPFAGPVASSKAALSTIAHAWRQELSPWGIGVTIIAPALVCTEAHGKLQRDAEETVKSMPETGRRLYGTTFTEMIRRAVKREAGGSPPTVIADAVVQAVLARRSPTRVVAGKGGRILSVLATLPAPMVDKLRRRLFGLPAPRSAIGAG
jgi:NAD(P)-dependent dehydrogenase (short-subunit alcohol dehydrogenase family)